MPQPLGVLTSEGKLGGKFETGNPLKADFEKNHHMNGGEQKDFSKKWCQAIC